MKNQFDKNGNKHGLWEWYYPNGKLSYRCNYKNGIFHGLWEWHYPSGRLGCKCAFKRGIQVGLCYNPSI